MTKLYLRDWFVSRYVVNIFIWFLEQLDLGEVVFLLLKNMKNLKGVRVLLVLSEDISL